MVTVEVYAEALDDGSLVRVLRRQMVDVYGLGPELGMQRIQELAALREGCRMARLGVVWRF